MNDVTSLINELITYVQKYAQCRLVSKSNKKDYLSIKSYMNVCMYVVN
jgi:hypothetical protein